MRMEKKRLKKLSDKKKHDENANKNKTHEIRVFKKNMTKKEYQMYRRRVEKDLKKLQNKYKRYDYRYKLRKKKVELRATQKYDHPSNNCTSQAQLDAKMKFMRKNLDNMKHRQYKTVHDLQHKQKELDNLYAAYEPKATDIKRQAAAKVKKAKQAAEKKAKEEKEKAAKKLEEQKKAMEDAKKPS